MAALCSEVAPARVRSTFRSDIRGPDVLVEDANVVVGQEMPVITPAVADVSMAGGARARAGGAGRTP